MLGDSDDGTVKLMSITLGRLLERAEAASLCERPMQYGTFSPHSASQSLRATRGGSKKP
jgi:hypothetical protein